MRMLSLAVALIAFPVLADDKAKPNTLTPKEIAEGWILLFDGETTFGWASEGNAKVADGVLMLGGSKATTLTANTDLGRGSHLAFAYCVDGAKWGESWLGANLPEPIIENVKREQSLKGDGTIRANLRDDGRVVFVVPSGETLHLRSFRARPLDAKSLFNGKDLTGWKEFKPAKDKKVASKFTVTKEGWINVKDGPGDLQTEGQWADFVGQFECISNGKHLNSGLFFRCIPGQYQQGYEAQIRNQWEGDDRTKPVDFGTGAIYRRQKARKVVSTDGEWFTMTVAAHGRHIATWVNGYQVTDWTDDRKEDDNARNGFKKGKGALSIQGHDPTTDLSFRNIRIQSLDPK
ncbi:MAG TPA: DUF1080 domain-containing protein [Gemmataceae bacterium]|nr:DUF1080 domain-containing protein [Gemmataceae bacterium]